MSRPVDVRRWKLHDVDQFVVPPAYRDELKGILLPEGTIQGRLDRLAEEISADYDGGIMAVCMLDGAMRTYGRLVKKITHPIKVATLKAKSRDGVKYKGSVDFSGFNFASVEGKHVLIVEDIIDTGRTLDATLREMEKHGATSLSIACLFDKPSKRLPDFAHIQPKYVGFTIPDLFIVGYGLDFNDRYRDLPHVAVLRDELIPRES
tara:strand:+ start:493 stop:1110 length:618 start_codon:yes stop_codon:yes gene_type:complete